MRVSLAQLLNDRAIVHPSRIEQVLLRHGELRIRLTGFPWWNPNADRTREHRIELVFGGVGEGSLDPRDFISDDDEALEKLGISQAANIPWAQEVGVAIFCSAPLPRPLDLYFTVHDFLAAHWSLRTPRDYLNGAADSRSFRRIVQSNGYLLGNFPPLLRDLVVAELRAQGVPHTELPGGFDAVGTLFVRFQRSQFFCASAEAEYEA